MATATRAKKTETMAGFGSGAPATASRPAKKGKSTCSGVEIRKAENGFTVSVRYDSGSMDYTPPKDHVFENLDGAMAFASSALGKGAK